MADTTTQSERIIGEAKRSLAVQRDGGFHRRSQSIGRGSRQLKTRHLLGKVKRMVLAGFVGHQPSSDSSDGSLAARAAWFWPSARAM